MRELYASSSNDKNNVSKVRYELARNWGWQSWRVDSR